MHYLNVLLPGACLAAAWKLTCGALPPPFTPRGPASVALSAGGALWSALTASKVLGRMSPALNEIRSLMLYPCLLMYASFALLGVY